MHEDQAQYTLRSVSSNSSSCVGLEGASKRPTTGQNAAEQVKALSLREEGARELQSLICRKLKVQHTTRSEQGVVSAQHCKPSVEKREKLGAEDRQ